MPPTRRSLANIANYHQKLKNYKKKYSRNIKTYNFKTVEEFEAYERQGKNNVTNEIEELTININSIPSVPESNTSRPSSPSSSSCTITPGGQKMKRVNGKWVPCVFGGKRKTRKGKKARRVTRRRR